MAGCLFQGERPLCKCEKGFFDKYGITIELTNGGGADKCMAALVSNQADIAFMGPEASVYVYMQGKDDYAINFAQLTQRDGSFIVGREDDDNFTVEKMRGKTILGGRKGGMPLMTLEWLLKEVWPTVVANRPSAVIKIVGTGNREWLKNYEHLKGVQIIGFVDSILDAYRDCHFTVVPIFYGSGTRIKVIESFAIGRRLISTKMGVQGAGLDENDYNRAETKDEWIKTLSTVKLDASEQLKMDQSRSKVAAMFGEKEIGEKFYNWMQTL